MSELKMSGEIYIAGKFFTLLPLVLVVTNPTTQLTKSEFQDVIESYSAGHTDLVFKVKPDNFHFQLSFE